MRAWGNRPDTFVCDEPLYAHYLKQTEVAHPGADEVIASHESDWRQVAPYLTGPVPEGKHIFYQKHMAHHLLPEIGRGWLEKLTHCFLIRDPREMLPSLDRIIPNPKIEDTGLPQQVEIFDEVHGRMGCVPPVVDSKDLLQDPSNILTGLCEMLEVPFVEQMLSWSPGSRSTDGIWAKHWYGNVQKTTGFRPFQPKDEPLQEHLEALYTQCLEYYNILYVHRIQA